MVGYNLKQYKYYSINLKDINYQKAIMLSRQTKSRATTAYSCAHLMIVRTKTLTEQDMSLVSLAEIFNCKARNYQQENYTEIFYILLLKRSSVTLCIAYIWKLKVLK